MAQVLRKRTLIFQMWTELRARWRFKFTLPRVRTATLEGVKLDVSSLSPLMKNNLLLGRYEVQERLLAQQSLTRDDAVRMIVSGFVEPIVKALPLEYAVEFNRLIELEMEKGY